MHRKRLVWWIAGLAVLVPGTVVGQDGSGPLTVGRVSFIGNAHITDEELRSAIATRQATLLARTPVLGALGLGESPPFDEAEFRRDVLRVQALYGARGFPDTRVDTVLIRAGGRVDIELRIAEREPVRVSSIEVRGAPAQVSPSELTSVIPLRTGDPFDRLRYANAQVLLRARLRDAGYPWVTIGSEFDVDSAGRSASVAFDVDPGPRAVIGDIEIEGRVRTDERVIRRTMTVRPGDAYSEAALYDDQLALFRTNLFSYVSLALADTARPSVTGDSLVTVRVRARVIESTLRTGRIGAGYGTRDCFRARSSLEWLDFAGGGRRLELNGRLSQIGTGDPFAAGLEHSLCPALSDEEPERLKLNYYAGFTLRDPLLSMRKLSATLGAFAERHTEIKAYLRETIRGELALTREVTSATDLTISYALSYGRTVADPGTFCILLDVCRLDDTRIFTQSIPRSVLGLELSRTTTASLLDPRGGTSLLAGVHWAGGAIGSDPLARYLRADAEFASYHPLGTSVMAWRLLGGIVIAPRVDGGERFVPPENRFYAGGPNSVRGFAQNELGPVTRILEAIDSSGAVPDSTIRTSAAGAEQLLLANLEWRFPLPVMQGALWGAVFTDAAWIGTRGEFAFSKVRATPGVGIRLPTAIGPVGLDVAYNPYRAEAGPLYRVNGADLELVRRDYRPRRGTLDRFRLSFSVGQAF